MAAQQAPNLLEWVQFLPSLLALRLIKSNMLQNGKQVIKLLKLDLKDYIRGVWSWRWVNAVRLILTHASSTLAIEEA
jgi:hypothetical protein